MKKPIIYALALLVSAINTFASEKGKTLVAQSCISCHAQNSKIAPSFETIYQTYSKKGDVKKTKELIINFLRDPSEKNIILKEAVKKYGHMPKIGLSRDEIFEVATFLAKGNFENIKIENNIKFKTPIEFGKYIKGQIKSELGKNLLGAIKRSKTVGAIDFCNEQAIPITSKVSKKHKATIRRASDKSRNSRNKASTEELKYIKAFKNQLASQSLQPLIVKKADTYHFYAPIVTNKMCLQCHGKVGSDISDDVYRNIKKKYPKDQATGYSPNQVRGLFHISWQKDKG
ncbi:MAG: c-type heme family protein [Bacteriovoracaceae bacterium]